MPTLVYDRTGTYGDASQASIITIPDGLATAITDMSDSERIDALDAYVAHQHPIAEHRPLSQAVNDLLVAIDTHLDTAAVERLTAMLDGFLRTSAVEAMLPPHEGFAIGFYGPTVSEARVAIEAALRIVDERIEQYGHGVSLIDSDAEALNGILLAAEGAIEQNGEEGQFTWVDEGTPRDAFEWALRVPGNPAAAVGALSAVLRLLEGEHERSRALGALIELRSTVTPTGLPIVNAAAL